MVIENEKYPPPNERPRYDIKITDDKILALEIWGMLNIPSLNYSWIC